MTRHDDPDTTTPIDTTEGQAPVERSSCSADGCERRVQARGLCHPHYKQAVRRGQLPPRAQRDPMTRFWATVEKTDTCWLWRGSITRQGYGQYSPSRGVTLRAHRLAWQADHGPVPAGMVLDHLCRNRSCVRPEHLEPVTPRENSLRGIGPTAINARKTRCARGHRFTPENTRLDGRGHRQCRTCERAKHARAYEQRKQMRKGVSA